MIDTVRLLLWNVGLGARRGPTDAAVDWLHAAEWDVAVLLEVDGPGLARLEATTWKLAVAGPPRGHALSTALAAKGSCGALDLIDAPAFDTRDGLYRYRVAVARVQVDDATWTVVGAHMPNSWRGRTKNHAWKETCFEALGEWISVLDSTQGLVVAMDSNRGDWGRSTSPIKDHSVVAQSFVRTPERNRLREAFLVADPFRTEKPETHWTGPNRRPQFFDRVFVGEGVAVKSCSTLLDRSGLGDLADHAPVVAELAR